MTWDSVWSAPRPLPARGMAPSHIRSVSLVQATGAGRRVRHTSCFRLELPNPPRKLPRHRRQPAPPQGVACSLRLVASNYGATGILRCTRSDDQSRRHRGRRAHCGLPAVSSAGRAAGTGRRGRMKRANGISSLVPAAVLWALPGRDQPAGRCKGLPAHAELRKALAAVQAEVNGGLGFQICGTMVDRDGVVPAVVHTSADHAEQRPDGRVISAQKAHTANAFSQPKFAVQPGGSPFGVPHSNPKDASAPYGGPATQYGTSTDPLPGERIGGRQRVRPRAGLVLVGGPAARGDRDQGSHVLCRARYGAGDTPRAESGQRAGRRGRRPQGQHRPRRERVCAATGHTTSKGFGHPTCGAESTKNPTRFARPIRPVLRAEREPVSGWIVPHRSSDTARRDVRQRRGYESPKRNDPLRSGQLHFSGGSPC